MEVGLYGGDWRIRLVSEDAAVRDSWVKEAFVTKMATVATIEQAKFIQLA